MSTKMFCPYRAALSLLDIIPGLHPRLVYFGLRAFFKGAAKFLVECQQRCFARKGLHYPVGLQSLSCSQGYDILAFQLFFLVGTQLQPQ